MHGSAQPEDQFPSTSAEDTSAGIDPSAIDGVKSRSEDRAKDHSHDNSNGNHTFEETELDSALQLLVERAQYITGATGTALALPQGEEMVCRASAGSSAPAVGARLQVRSGLTGESIARRQLLRCDNAEADPRVNLETCRALGIASIVVLPLLRRNGEVRGLFELFSDHPYAFEERDLIALERMAALTLTALDLAEQRQSSAPAPAARREPDKPSEIATHLKQSEIAEPPKHSAERPPEHAPKHPANEARPVAVIPLPISAVNPVNPALAAPVTIPMEVLPTEVRPSEVLSVEPPVVLAPNVAPPAAVPEAMLRVQKCAFCGFPVSEGRTLCLDCERKDHEKEQRDQYQRRIEKLSELKQADQPIEQQSKQQTEQPKIEPTEQIQAQDSASGVPAPPEEFVPAFLANPGSAKESWYSNPVNLLAIAVLILCILVAIVVFR